MVSPMQNHLQPISSISSLTVSQTGIDKALRHLASDHRPTSHTPLLPPHVCDAVIARHSDVGKPISEVDARKAALALLAGYPGAFTADPGERLPYMEKIKATFCLYPAWAVAKVVAPGFRFDGNASFRPNDKEIAQALDRIVAEHRAYAVKARWHKEEGHHRAREAEAERTRKPIALGRVRELVADLRAMPGTGPVVRRKNPASSAMKTVLDDIAAKRGRMMPEELAEHETMLAKLNHHPSQKQSAA